jgi:hypothetical protein
MHVVHELVTMILLFQVTIVWAQPFVYVKSCVFTITKSLSRTTNRMTPSPSD